MLISTTIKTLPIHGGGEYFGNGVIAGDGSGIVTVAGNPAARPVYLFDAQTMTLLKIRHSNADGHYIFRALNENKKYLVMVRDDKKAYEPFAWDWVSPDTSLTAAQQLEKAQQWY